MPITNHDSSNETLIYTDFDPTGLTDKQDLQPVISSIADTLTGLGEITPVDIYKIVGNSTLTDGGSLGAYLNIFMVYIEEFRKKGSLDKKEVGVLYGKAMELASSNALSIELSTNESIIAKAKAVSDLALVMSKTNESSAQNAATTVDIAKSIYEYNNILPLTRLSLEEDIVHKHIQHEISSITKATATYNLETTLPAQTLGINAKTSETNANVSLIGTNEDLVDENILTSKYHLSNTLPKNLLKIIADTDLVGTNEDLVDENILTSKYHLANTLPKNLLKIIAETNLIGTNEDLVDENILTSQYHLSNTLPKNLLKVIAETNLIGTNEDLVDENILTSKYHLSNTLPKNLLKILAETSLIGTNEDVAAQRVLNETKQVAIETYRLNTILPAEVAKLIADTAVVGKNEDILDLQISDVIPAEVDKLEQEVVTATQQALIAAEQLDIAKEELNIKKYQLLTVLPSQVAKTDADTALVSADKLIKNAYRTNVQPQEALIAAAKAVQERINAGIVGTGTPLPTARINQLEKQTELYTRQESAYDDNKFQKLLDTQINYNALIFADDPNPQALTVCTNSSISSTYASLLS